MARYYMVDVMASDETLLRRQPTSLAAVSVDTTAMSDDSTVIRWTFEESQFPLLVEFFAWLCSVSQCRVMERGYVLREKDAPLNERFNWLGAAPCDGVVATAGSVLQNVRCSCCGDKRRHLVDKPSLDLDWCSIYCPGLFYVPRVEVMLMSRPLFEALEKAGLSSGLRRIPITEDGKPYDDFAVIYSDAPLGWPVGRYQKRPPCSACGSQAPRFVFSEMYPVPEKPAHWTWSSLLGPCSVYVSSAVYTWMNTEGRDLVYVGDENHFVNAVPRFTYPDDLTAATLPTEICEEILEIERKYLRTEQK